MSGNNEKEDSKQRQRQVGQQAAMMSRRIMKRKMCRVAPQTMTSGNKMEADVQVGGEKEDDRMGMRRKTSSNGQEEQDE